MSRLAPLALGLSLGMSALVALSLPALARGGGHGGGGGGHGGGGGMRMGGFGGGGGGFGVGRFGGGGGFAGGFMGGPRVGVAALGMRPGFAGRPIVAGGRFTPRSGFIGRPGNWGRPYNRVRWDRWNRRGWWGPAIGVGLATAPYWGWGWDDYYANPYINVGYDVGISGLGGFCATPVRTCQLIDAAPIGTGCSCQVSGGRARGVVSP